MQRFLSRAAISLAAAVAAIILVAASVGFLGVALYLLLVPVMAAPFAALAVGLAGFAIAGLIALVIRMTWRGRPAGRRVGSAAPGRAGDVNDVAATLGELAAREMTSRAQAHPYTAFAVALAAGLAIGISPELRNFLTGLLKK